MRKLSIAALLLAVLALAVAGVFAAEEKAKADKEEAKFEYVGAKKCKICHKEVYESWSKTSHATNFSKLSAEEQKKDECARCHITGTDAKGVLIENVECEACHGPGSAYKSPKIMSKKAWPAEPEKYKQMAIDAGLIYPTAETCTRCHQKEGNPNFKPFDFEKRRLEVHVMSEETKAKYAPKKDEQ